jgi:aminoglycoside/choline kinase family phosphotransferase
MIPPAAAPAFLAAHGWPGARIEPLAGDASFRRYFRVIDGSRSAVLMDAPPPHEDPRPFIAMARYLRGIGLSAPEILAGDLDRGLLLIEDFGGERMREAVDVDPAREATLYAGVTDVLVALHRHAPPPGLAPHGIDQWIEEVMLFPDWYGPAVGLDLCRDSFAEAWRAALAPVAKEAPTPVTLLRDYHAENVMLLAGQAGVRHFGLLDFQDALAGHPAYDLVSILEDARRDVTPSIETAMIDRYCAATGAGDDFRRAYWVLGGQRNTRILGVFCRLWQRDNKPHYRLFQPRMWGLLDRNLARPELAPVRAWFDAHVPVSHRAAIWPGLITA